MEGVVRRLVVLVFVVLALSAGSSAARSLPATVGVYPSGTTFSASGGAPAHATSSVSLAMPIGGVDDATVLVRGAQHVSIVSPTIDSPLQLSLFFAHYVSVAGKAVPDALMPWDGSPRSTAHTNQPLWLQVTVTYGTPPGTHHAAHLPGVGRRGRRRGEDFGSAHGHRLAGDPPRAEPGRGKPADSLQLLAPVVLEQGGRSVRRLARVDPAGALQLPRLLPALAEQLGLRQSQVWLRLHERPPLVARQDGPDDRRSWTAHAVRLDVDPDLEQPLEPEHLRRRPVAVQATGLVRVPQVRARVLAEARLALLGRVRVRDGRAGRLPLQDRRQAGEGDAFVLRRRPRAHHGK